MHIFIKTFNRPYYLDRCLSSIQKFAEGGPYKIIVMDDGTDEKYLSIIKEKFPEVIIETSEYAAEKVQKIKNHIENGTPVSGLKLPSEFWKSVIDEYATDYFLLLEDDIWLCEPLNMYHTEDILYHNSIASLKLNYFGNERLISGTKQPINDLVTIIKPNLLTKSPFLFKHVITKNPLKVLSVLKRLQLYDPNDKINYYSIYTVAGAILKKEYYNFLWEGFSDIKTEDGQLLRALEFYVTDKYNFAFTEKPIINTSFSSSATNAFSDIDYNVYAHNYLLNEAWLNNEFITTENFDSDIDENKIKSVLEGKANVSNWKKWSDRFKEQYINAGHQIE